MNHSTYRFLHEVCNVPQELDIIISEECHCLTLAACTPCSPDAMNVADHRLWEIVVDHAVHSLEVDTSAH